MSPWALMLPMVGWALLILLAMLLLFAIFKAGRALFGAVLPAPKRRRRSRPVPILKSPAK